jgi:hypothetical protein
MSSTGSSFLGTKSSKDGAPVSNEQDSQWRPIGCAGCVPAREIDPAVHDAVRQRTKRRVPLTTRELIERLNPVLRGWDYYYKRAHIRLLFNRLDRWIML